jgi:glucuronate isomerase
MPPPSALLPHPDRLFPPDPAVRSVARRLYDEVRDFPVLSPHGHIDPRVLLADQPFDDPTGQVGAPWWFLDAPDAIRRWRSAVTETVTQNPRKVFRL